MEAITHVDLCSGIGGFSYCARQLGWKTVAHSEIEPYCCKIYHRHFPDSECLGDMKKVKWRKYAKEKKELGKGHLVLTAGWPCQPNSYAGQRKGIEDKRDLWSECARAIRELRPNYFLGENVPGALTVNKGQYFNRVLSDLAACGYDAEWQIISASQIQAPHQRKRLWIIAYNRKKRIQGIVKKAICWKHAFSWCKNVRRAEDFRGRSTIPEPIIRRNSDGFSAGVDRLKGLGNAIVPQCAYINMKLIDNIIEENKLLCYKKESKR